MKKKWYPGLQQYASRVNLDAQPRRRLRGRRPRAGVLGPGAGQDVAARTRRVGGGDGSGN